MVKAEINAGVCGFKTIVKAYSEDMQNVNIEIESECPNIKSMGGELKNIDAFKECFSKIGETKVYEISKKYCKHPGCPVPSGIIKCVEVASGLALPKDVQIIIKKEDTDF